MYEWMLEIFGTTNHVNGYQAAARALVMFFCTLFFIKLAGIRTFGLRSGFDNVIVIVLGSILSRGVIGTAPMVPVLISSFVLCLIHRILAILSTYSDWLSHLLKAKEVKLYEKGKLRKDRMKFFNITEGDLMAQVRLRGRVNNLDEIDEITLERTGQISIIKKKKNP
jgi:uncharacterized membrane protein YcaP (DUF421 family)